MARNRRKTGPWWMKLPLWAVVAALVGGGMWQALAFRQSLLAEVRTVRAADAVATLKPAETETTVQAVATLGPENATGQETPSADAWAVATTPAALYEPAASGAQVGEHTATA